MKRYARIVKKMPVVKQIKKNCFEYQCSCGETINLEWDERERPPKKLVKCFKCIKKEYIENQKLYRILNETEIQGNKIKQK